MTNFLSTSLRFLEAAAIFTALFLPHAWCQNPSAGKPATLRGTVGDPQNHPLERAAVSLENKDTGKTLNTVTDSQGHYDFAGISPGTYTLRVKREGWREASKEPLALGLDQEMIVDLRLQPEAASASNRNAAAPMEFSVE